MLLSQALSAPEPSEGPLTSLDPLETGVEIGGIDEPPTIDLPDEPGVAFRHTGWLRQRNRVCRALIQGECSAGRVLRFRMCGAFAWLQRGAEDAARVRVVASLCHDRFCLPCQRLHAHTVASNLQAACQGREIRFVTLTVRHSPEPLRGQMESLYAAFRRLRQRVWWRENVTGGAAFLEVTLSAGDGCWHPHLHVLVEGRWLERSRLSAEWRAVTGDSFVVDVRRPRSLDQTVSYVTKYVTKGLPTASLLDSDRLVELILAISGRRTILAFGTWRRIRLSARPESGEWISLGPLSVFIAAASRGDRDAIATLALAYGVEICQVRRLACLLLKPG